VKGELIGEKEDNARPPPRLKKSPEGLHDLRRRWDPSPGKMKKLRS